MLSKDQLTSFVLRLQHAHSALEAMPQLSSQLPDMTLEDAYAISRAWAVQRQDEGRRLRGYKVALSSNSTQAAFGASEPALGWVFDDMVFDSGDRIPASRFGAANVELELAFILGKPLQGPRITVFDVLQATDFVVPAFEIVDARVQLLDPVAQTPRKLVDLVADNSVAAGIVLGGQPIRPADIDLSRVSAVLYKNGAIEETGVSAAVMSHPARSVAWLANKLSQWGEKLEPGHVIMSGTLTRPTKVRKGDVMHGDFGPLGQVAWQMV